MNKNKNLLSYVAELYYERGLSQKEIGSIIGASRPTVSRLIEDAKRQGVVEIKINAPITKNPKLSNKLRKAYKLHDAIVVDGDFDFNKSIANVGKAAASVLSTYLEDGQSLGIAWGRAISSFVDAIEPDQFDRIHIAQMVGCISAGNPNIDSFAVAQRLAKKMNGTYSSINSPLFVETKEVYEYLIKEPLIKYSLEKACNVDVCINGIANLFDRNNTITQAGFFDYYNLERLIDLKTVGNYLGRFIDKNGNEVDTDPLYSISAPLSATKNAKYSFLVVAGEVNAEATAAVLRAKLSNILVCDEQLAKRLLEIK